MENIPALDPTKDFNGNSVDDHSEFSKNILPDVTITGAENKNTNGFIRLVLVKKPESSDHIGFNLTRSHLDPYPWVKSVDHESAAGRAGLRDGDCLLRVDDVDLLGLTVSDVARLVRGPEESVQLMVWSRGTNTDWDPESLVCGPLPSALRQLSQVVSAILLAMECPVCSSTVKPPAATCPRGHLLCATCRATLTVCPLCRVPLQQPLRNLLADQVYNCVIEAFDLQGDKAKAKLTDNLFGNVKVIKSESRQNIDDDRGSTNGSSEEFPPHDGHGRRLKWGTHKLLQRLLPGRARSTGNIARATRSPTRNPLYAEERDLSRSLSNLDIPSCREPDRIGSNSLNSLACTAGGSFASLSTPVVLSMRETDISIPGYVDEELIENSSQCSDVRIYPEVYHTNIKGFHCPADSKCTEIITDDVQMHILNVHKKQINLKAADEIYIEPDSHDTCDALLHSTGRWLYPKCERDESDGGLRVWCWAQESSDVSSQYQLGVEVWPKNAEDSSDVATDVIKDKCNGNVSKNKKNLCPLVKLASPIMSLKNVSWERILASRQALFLGDSILLNEAKIKIKIDKLC